MRDQALFKILETLKTTVQPLPQGEGSTEASQTILSQLSALFSEESLSQLVGNQSPIEVDAGVYIHKIIEAVEQAGIAIGEEAPRARLLLELGELLYIQGSWDGALQRFEEALALSDRIGYTEGKAGAFKQIGRLKRRRRDWDGAKEALDQALQVYRELGEKSGEAEALLNIGNIQFEQGHYEEAQQVYQEALAVSEGLGFDRMVGDINLSLGAIQQVLGQQDAAITHYTECLARYEVSGDHRQLGQVYFNLGISYEERGEWERSGATYERALQIARESGDLGLVGSIYLRRGEMQAKLSDAAMAMAYGQKALEIFYRLEDPLGRADVYRLYGRVAGLKGAWERAAECLGESERLQRQYGCRLGEAEVEEERGWVYARQGNHALAMQSYQRALGLYQELKAEGKARHIRDAVLKLQNVLVE